MTHIGTDGFRIIILSLIFSFKVEQTNLTIIFSSQFSFMNFCKVAMIQMTPKVVFNSFILHLISFVSLDKLFKCSVLLYHFVTVCRQIVLFSCNTFPYLIISIFKNIACFVFLPWIIIILCISYEHIINDALNFLACQYVVISQKFLSFILRKK